MKSIDGRMEGRDPSNKPFSRPARPWSSDILPEEVEGNVLRDVQRFMSDKEIKWYGARGRCS